MTTLIVRSNADTVSDVLIPDLGIVIPAGGGQETFTDSPELPDVQTSAITGSISLLINDGAFPGGSDPSDHTLILNDGTVDIPPGDVPTSVSVYSTALPRADVLPRSDSSGKLVAGWGGDPGTLATLDVSGAIPDAQVPVEHLNQLTTSLRVGGELSINGGDNTKFDVAAGAGVIVDNHSDPDNPVITRVTWGSFTAQAPTGLGTSLRSYVAVNSLGNLVQQTTQFTVSQRRDLVILGSLAHISGAQIDSAASSPIVGFNQHQEAIDFIDAIGPVNIDGNEYSADGASLNLAKSAGTAFHIGAAYAANKKTPSRTVDGVLSPAVFFYTFQNGAGGFTVGSPATTIDPDNYDDGSGSLAAVPAGQWQIQRIFFFPGSVFTGIHYGQQTFATKGDAIVGLRTATFEANPEADNAVFRSWLVVQQGATDLSDTAQAEFITAGKLGLADVVAGTGGGEINTITNVGAGGIGLFKQKTGVNLELKNINAGSTKITIADDVANDEVDIDVDETNINHDNLSGFVANEHIDHSTVNLTAGAGLTGGGNITASRSFALDINGLTTDPTPDVAADFLATYDDSAGAVRKVAINKLPLVQNFVSANATANTASGTNALLTSMTLTPASGTYLVWASVDVSNNANGGTTFISIFSGGVQQTNSVRAASNTGVQFTGSRHTLATASRVTVNGSQAIEIRWRTNGTGTSTALGRSLTILRVA